MPKLDPPPIEEEVKEEKKPRKYVYKRDHDKSLRQIAQESIEEVKAVEVPKEEEKDKPEEKPEETKPVEPEKPAEPLEDKIDPVKIAEDAAKKASDETAKHFQEEISKIKESDQTLSEKKKAEDELISAWDKEGRLPTDYKEIFNEAQRISEVKMRQAWEAREKEAAKQESERKVKEEQVKAENEKQLKERQESLNKRVNEELDELVSSKFIAKGREGNLSKEAEDLLNFGIKMNTERVAKGQDPIDSLQRIYFMHYKPFKEASGQTKVSEQPAGADAPVSGARGSAHTEAPADKFIYARDHNRSFRQIAMDGIKRMAGK